MGQVVGPSFEVKGIEPPDVRRSPMAKRRAFWVQVSQLVIEAKDLELRQGLDRWGDPLAALSQYTIEHRESAMGPADQHAPPLQPAHGLSRTRSLFWAEPTTAANGVVCWWLYDTHTGESWGEILRVHAQGGRRLPIRDVIGLAPQSLAQVKRKAATWWSQYEGEEPEPRPLPYRSPGWGKSVRTPEGKFIHVGIEDVQGEMRGKLISGEEALRRRELPRRQREKLKTRQVKIGNHVYTMQGGLGATVPKQIPRAFATVAIKPKVVSSAEPQAIVQKPVVNPPPVVTMTLERFASVSMTAARAVPEAVRYNSRKVWIIDAYHEIIKGHPDISLDEFKRRLLEAHQAGKIELARADAPGWSGEVMIEKDRISNIQHGSFATYQVIVL